MAEITRICITGGSGFIGTNLVEFYIARKDVEVFNIDIAAPKNAAHMPYWKKVDILDKEELYKAIREIQPHYVLHLAARTDLRETKDINNYRTNFDGTANLMDAMRDISSVQRVLFVSTMLVNVVGYIPKHDTDYCPTTLYGESKMMMEQLVRSAHHTYSWAIVRPTSIWGPWFGEPYRNFFDLVLQKKYFHIGGKSGLKSYGFVGNAVQQLNELLFTGKNIEGGTFRLADYHCYDIREWGDELAGELGTRIKTIPYFVFKMAALAGDVITRLGASFPMTSFRLSNMTTNNCIPDEKMQKVLPVLPYTRKEGNKITLRWLKEQSGV